MGLNLVHFTKLFRCTRFPPQTSEVIRTKIIGAFFGSGIPIVQLKGHFICLSILQGKYSLNVLSYFQCFLISYPQNSLFFELVRTFHRFGRQNPCHVIYYQLRNFMKILKMQMLSLLNVSSKFCFQHRTFCYFLNTVAPYQI